MYRFFTDINISIKKLVKVTAMSKEGPEDDPNGPAKSMFLLTTIIANIKFVRPAFKKLGIMCMRLSFQSERF